MSSKLLFITASLLISIGLYTIVFYITPHSIYVQSFDFLNAGYFSTIVTIGSFSTYHSEADLLNQRVYNDIRTQTRQALGSLHTLDVLTKHDEMASLIKKLLLSGSDSAPAWNKIGLSVDSVSVRGTRVPAAVSDSYAAAQQSQINVQKAQNDLDAQKIQSQQLVQSAQAQAESNDLLNAHPLSDGTLVQRYLETLQAIGDKGNMIVIPEGFAGILQLQNQAQQVTGK